MCLVLTVAACHRTAPQKPSQRSSEGTLPDVEMMALMEVNRRMANEADKLLLQYVDSLHHVDGTEFAQMICGAWKSRRDSVTRDKNMYNETPQINEKWRVRVRTLHLDGRLASDVEGVYTMRKFDLPIAVEDALGDMYPDEKALILAPWYTAYGVHGNEHVAGYENVLFEITLGEKQ